MFLWLVVAASASLSLDKPLLTVPLNKNGEQYALLDFYSTDPAHIQTTAEEFCRDHIFSAHDKAMIIAHVTTEMEKLQAAQAQQQQQAAQAVGAAQTPVDLLKAQQAAAAAQHATQGLPDVNGVSASQPNTPSKQTLCCASQKLPPWPMAKGRWRSADSSLTCALGRLMTFMKQNNLNAADVLHTLADLMPPLLVQ